MKKFGLSLFAFLFIVVSLHAQKTINDLNAQKRTVGSFQGIEVATGIKLYLTQGETEEVAVSAAQTEHRDRIVTEVKNGVLKIYYDKKLDALNKKNETKDLRAYVSCKALDKLNVTTGAEAEIDGTIKTPSLDINVNTGARLEGSIDAGAVKLDQNTGSKVTLKGKATKLEASGSTGSKFNGDGLQTSQSDVKVSTGAIISIHATDKIEAKANTGGVIRYKGEVTSRSIKTRTGGTVTRI